MAEIKSAEVIPFNKPLKSEVQQKCSFCGRELIPQKDKILEGHDGAIMCVNPCGIRFAKLMNEVDQEES